MSTARKPGVGQRRTIDIDGVGPARDIDAGLDDGVDECAEVIARRTGQRDPAAGHGAGDHEGAGFDPVGDDPVVRAAQTPLALDFDRVGERPGDLGAHLLEEGDQVVDLRLLCGRSDRGVTVGQRRGEHRVLGPHHRYEREADLRAA